VNTGFHATWLGVGCEALRATSGMRRRDFIAGVGSTAAWPLAAQSALPLIGFLGSGQSDNVTLPAILQGLREAGFV